MATKGSSTVLHQHKDIALRIFIIGWYRVQMPYSGIQRLSPNFHYFATHRGNYVSGMACYDETSHYHQQHMLAQSQQQILSPSATNGHIVSGSMMSPTSMLNNDALSPSGTPTRGTKVRPSQPPPAPPSATNSSSRYCTHP